MEKSNKSFSQSLSHLKAYLEKINNNNYLKVDVDSALNEIDNLTTILKGVRKLFFILFSIIIALLIILAITFSYNKKLNTFQEDIKSLKDDSLVINILDIKKAKLGDSISTSYDYFTENGEVIKYKELKTENDSLLNIITKNDVDNITKAKNQNSIEVENENLQKKLRLVLRNYPIKFRENDDKIIIESKEIDSAMILLKQFRHKMRYNKKDDSWTIFYK